MLKVILVVTIVFAVFIATQSNSFSRETVITGSPCQNIIKTVKDQNPQTGIFKLYDSKQTQFENTTVIQFEIGEEAKVLLTVCDSKGIIVETLVNNLMYAGVYNVYYKSENKITPGELTYKLEVNGISGIKNVFSVK